VTGLVNQMGLRWVIIVLCLGACSSADESATQPTDATTDTSSTADTSSTDTTATVTDTVSADATVVGACGSEPAFTLPADLDPGGSFLDASAAEQLAFCPQLASAPGPAPTGDCDPAALCEQFTAALRQQARADCALTRGEFAACMRGEAARCASGTIRAALHPDCQTVRRCLLPEDAVSLTELDRHQRRGACRGLAQSCLEPTDDRPCLESLDNLAAGCAIEGTCDTPTVGALLSCDPCGAPCEATAAVAAPVDDTRKAADLTRLERRRVCEAAYGPPVLVCTTTVLSEAELEAPEECVSNLSALAAVCAEGGHADCERTVADLDACAEAGDAPCCPAARCGAEPWSGAVEKAVASASDGELESFCRWRTAQLGGPGYVPVACDHNVEASSVDTVAGCVADMRKTLIGCGASLADVAACTAAMRDGGNACHRVGRFGSCRELGDYESCHNWDKYSDCKPIHACVLGAGSPGSPP